MKFLFSFKTTNPKLCKNLMLLFTQQIFQSFPTPLLQYNRRSNLQTTVSFRLCRNWTTFTLKGKDSPLAISRLNRKSRRNSSASSKRISQTSLNNTRKAHHSKSTQENRNQGPILKRINIKSTQTTAFLNPTRKGRAKLLKKYSPQGIPLFYSMILRNIKESNSSLLLNPIR